MSNKGKSVVKNKTPSNATIEACADPDKSFLNVCPTTQLHLFFQITAFKCYLIVATLHDSEHMQFLNYHILTTVLPACLLVPALSPEIVNRYMPAVMFCMGLYLFTQDLSQIANSIFRKRVVGREFDLWICYIYYFVLNSAFTGFQFVFDVYISVFMTVGMAIYVYVSRDYWMVTRMTLQCVLLWYSKVEYVLVCNLVLMAFDKFRCRTLKRLTRYYVLFAVCIALGHVEYSTHAIEEMTQTLINSTRDIAVGLGLQ